MCRQYSATTLLADDRPVAHQPRRAFPSWLVVLAAASVASLVVLPVAVVLVRGFAVGAEEAVATLVRPRVGELLVNSLGLVALTVVGTVVIGVAAVITMVALGTGAQRAVEAQIAALGTNVLTIRPGQGWFRGVRSGEARLTVDDAFAVAREAGAVTGVAPEMTDPLQVAWISCTPSPDPAGADRHLPEWRAVSVE